jgi:hypothetical protein
MLVVVTGRARLWKVWQLAVVPAYVMVSLHVADAAAATVDVTTGRTALSTAARRVPDKPILASCRRCEGRRSSKNCFGAFPMDREVRVVATRPLLIEKRSKMTRPKKMAVRTPQRRDLLICRRRADR